MGRVKKFAASMATGYLAMAVNIGYTMASIPLALHYLGKEEFGLWALAQQISGYLMLLDFGMSSALSRFLADHKDEAEGDRYGSMLLTGSLVFLIQGMVIALVGVGLSWAAPFLFAVPAELRLDFTLVLSLLSIVAGVSVMLRSIGSPLWAFQRLDVVNGCAALSLLLSLGWIWWAFGRGWGIYSLAAAGVPGTVAGTAIALVICWRNGYYARPGRWGRPQWAVFRKVFGFGKDVVLMTLGSQLVNASQILIIGRFIGLEAAGTFAVATKFYTLGQQFVAKVLEGAAPTLTEMFVRGETSRFRERLEQVILLTLALSAVGGSCLAMGNRSLISLWTSGAVSWTWGGDVFLAALILVIGVSRCFVGVFGIVGQLQPVRYLYLLEGSVFVLLAILAGRGFGLWGILVAMLLAHLSTTAWNAMRAAVPYLGSLRTLRRPFVVALGILALGSVAGWLGLRAGISPLSTIFLLPLTAMLSCLLAWFYLFPYNLRGDLLGRMRRWFPFPPVK
ncbi:MAG: oligosaccharide flippase family protein [Candidatus Methylacidiphilales bacterium]|nr:oligosaccharide flippase family protein [Candidatus Methylacidiphilales bacterium]